MSTLGNILSNAGQALHAHQKATQVAGHNINNALTEGYSRQRVELEAANPLQTPHGTIGGGVRIADITRARDSLLDQTFRRESSATEGYRLRHQMLGQIETNLLEFGEQGFGATLDAFWDAWSELANHPGNDAARAMVQTRGGQVVSHLRQLDSGIEEVQQSAIQRIRDARDNINHLANDIANLNRQIIAAESGGGTAADLRDRRDLALDELARITPIQIIERENGGMGVAVGGLTIVDDTVSRELTARFTNDPVSRTQRVEIQSNTGVRLEGTDGQLGALIDLLNNELPGIRNQLDNLARGIALGINGLHQEGVANPIDPNTGERVPATGIDFFQVEYDQQSGEPLIDLLNAGNLRLSDRVAGDRDSIAIGRGEVDQGGNLVYLAGRTDIALEIAELRDSGLTGLRGRFDPGLGVDDLEEKTIASYYQGIVTGLGAKVASARNSTTAHETLARQAETRRESVSGVSTDEELIKLIQTQTAYQAAARVITTVDEMLQSLLNI